MPEIKTSQLPITGTIDPSSTVLGINNSNTVQIPVTLLTSTIIINAFTQANTANQIAINAYSKANVANQIAIMAFDKANTGSSVLGVFTQANTANQIAINAYSKANVANQIAIMAFDKANTGSSVLGVFTQANTANQIAINAFTQANTANNNAVMAYSKANTANQIAIMAFNTANSVGGGANVASAFAQANTANQIAIMAFNTANTNAANNQTMYIGTTPVSINRSSGVLQLSDINLILTQPATSQTSIGTLITSKQCGESITIMDLVYLKSDGKWWKSNTSSSATGDGILGISLETKTANNTMNVAAPISLIRNDSWSWTIGQTLFGSATTPGGITATAPSGTDNIIRPIGWAYLANTIYFNPSTFYWTRT